VTIEVRRLEAGDDRSRFRSGNPDLDRFFHRYAGQNQFRHHIGTTWIAVDAAGFRGFVTWSAGVVRASALPEFQLTRLPAYPLPVLRIARLAVAEDAQGSGVGAALLHAAFVAAHRMAADFGCVGVLVDAKPDAVAWYDRFGFEAVGLVAGELGDRPLPATMFLELGAIPASPVRGPD
jgi:GNAT superfamily N-acetyltransferase